MPEMVKPKTEQIKTAPTGAGQIHGAFRQMILPELQAIASTLARIERKIDAQNKSTGSKQDKSK